MNKSKEHARQKNLEPKVFLLRNRWKHWLKSQFKFLALFGIAYISIKMIDLNIILIEMNGRNLSGGVMKPDYMNSETRLISCFYFIPSSATPENCGIAKREKCAH